MLRRRWKRTSAISFIRLPFVPRLTLYRQGKQGDDRQPDAEDVEQQSRPAEQKARSAEGLKQRRVEQHEGEQEQRDQTVAARRSVAPPGQNARSRACNSTRMLALRIASSSVTKPWSRSISTKRRNIAAVSRLSPSAVWRSTT